jgi:hypothetical protein
VPVTSDGGARPRWDTDTRLAGVADAAAFAGPVDELAGLARRPDWVAEEPEVHLVPHLRGAEPAGLRVLRTQAGADGVLHVAAEHDPGLSRRDIRRLAWVLIGTVAETISCVSERRDEDAVIFDVITGIPDGPGPFASHGHTIRFVISPA